MGLTKDLGALPRVITVSGNNVGVSVTNPSVQFNVGHASHGLGMAYLGATSLPASAGLFTDSGINGGQGFGSLQIKSRTDFSGYSINFFTALTANVPVERMRIASNGNIGVGTTNPIYNVDVNGGSTTPYLRVYRDTGYVMLGAGLNFSAIYSRNNSDVARNFIIEAANVGIGTDNPGVKLEVNGLIRSIPVYNNTTATAANLVVSAGGTFERSTSSLKYKKEVRDYDKGLETLLKIKPVYYKGKSESDGDKQFAGLIAEEIHELGLNEFVQYAEDGTPDALAYTHMIALLVKAIQEQQETIKQLENRILNIENK